MLIVNEPGLYRLIFQSRKPEAERFKAWVFNEVLPRIRRAGRYALPGADAEALYREILGRLERVTASPDDKNAGGVPRISDPFAVRRAGGEDPAEWINTARLSRVYGKSKRTTLAHARMYGWTMRVGKANNVFCYEFLLSSLPGELRAARRQSREGADDENT
jgi:hypothetical protein